VGQAICGNIIGRTSFANYLTKATNTLSKYVIINDFPLQQRLRERASILRHTYIACLLLFTHQTRFPVYCSKITEMWNFSHVLFQVARSWSFTAESSVQFRVILCEVLAIHVKSPCIKQIKIEKKAIKLHL
jgi:hypothetical protein